MIIRERTSENKCPRQVNYWDESMRGDVRTYQEHEHYQSYIIGKHLYNYLNLNFPENLPFNQFAPANAN